MNAYVTICNPAGQNLLSVSADDYDPYVVLSFTGVTIQLTRSESRQVADALRAAALRHPYVDRS